MLTGILVAIGIFFLFLIIKFACNLFYCDENKFSPQAKKILELLRKNNHWNKLTRSFIRNRIEGVGEISIYVEEGNVYINDIEMPVSLKEKYIIWKEAKKIRDKITDRKNETNILNLLKISDKN